MRGWVSKAIVQKVISFLPYNHKINFWFQKNITKGVELTDEHFNDKLVHCFDHIELISKSDNIICFELGTGWYPIIPIGLFLTGVESVTSIDIHPFCNKERILTTVDKFIEWESKGKLEMYLPELIEERWADLLKINEELEFDDIKRILKLELVVGDARKLNFKDNTFDFITSNNVFEHIYPDILNGILVELERVLKTDGKMSHFIDMSDHFAHNDDSISVYNYLKFSDSQWRLIDNSIQPQNRMRISEYSKMFDNLSLKYSYFNTRNGDKEVLEQLNLNSKIKAMNLDEAAKTHTHVMLSEN